MGARLTVDWQESSEELKRRYQKEVHPQRRTRLQALWQLSLGKRIRDVVESTGASYRSVQQWLRWYRQGGLFGGWPSHLPSLLLVSSERATLDIPEGHLAPK